MVRIVVGGQINKREIADFTCQFLGDKATVDVKGDLQYDYYIGACNTGGGGALALALSLLGADNCATVSMPGKIFPDEEIIAAVQGGKTAFGFTAQHAEKVLPVLLTAIIEKKGE